jgi:hypothetical protein
MDDIERKLTRQSRVGRHTRCPPNERVDAYLVRGLQMSRVQYPSRPTVSELSADCEINGAGFVP